MKKIENRNTKDNKPRMSSPVISRSGKIGRVSRKEPEKTVDFEKEEAAEVRSRETAMTAAATDVTISDSEFYIEEGKKAKKRKDTHTVKSKEKRPFPVSTVIACVICTVLLMSMIINFVQINEYTKEISVLNAQVSEMNKQKNELSAELDEKNNVEELRKYLDERAEELGMIEEGKMNPPEAVTPKKNDSVEDYEAEEESDALIVTVLNALAKNITDAWEAFAG